MHGIVYRTEDEALSALCPVMQGHCRGPICAAWAWGPDRYANDVVAHSDAIFAWLSDNPLPSEECEEEAWERRATDFAASLPRTAPPEQAGWVWVAGFDEQTHTPYARWSKTAQRVGYCADVQLASALGELARTLRDDN